MPLGDEQGWVLQELAVLKAPQPSSKRWPKGRLKISTRVPQVTQNSSLKQGFFTP